MAYLFIGMIFPIIFTVVLLDVFIEIINGDEK
jgi:hypothetical protein